MGDPCKAGVIPWAVAAAPYTAPDPEKSFRFWGEKVQALQAASGLLKGTPPHLPLCLLVKILSHRPILDLFQTEISIKGATALKLERADGGCGGGVGVGWGWGGGGGVDKYSDTFQKQDTGSLALEHVSLES